MRILAVDPGDKQIGIALSDPTGTIANPLTVLKHIQRAIDAATIAQLATENAAGQIIVGATYDPEGNLTPQGRKGARLAKAIQAQTTLPVTLWDESGSTQTARRARVELGLSRKRRAGHFDALAATVILQTYLDSRHP
ncbi:MAG: Holliday junction resolvase RuvX [Anaerolineales bacterium]